MKHDVDAFRSHYRANINPHYNVWLHGGFVLGYGLLCLGFFWHALSHVQPLEWLAIPLTLVFCNCLIYVAHRNLGHHKHRLSRLFYKRHTGDHHSFFVAGRMACEIAEDWRVVFFPAWLIVIYSIACFATWWVLAKVNGNVAALFSGTLLMSYLSYEVFHGCEHLPETHPLARLPWIRHMRRLHDLHHRRDLMQTHNFNIVFPLTDWLRGTLHWEPVDITEGRRAMTVQRHEVDINGDPERVLDYACSATRWPEWHPSSLRVDGPAGPVPAGGHFEEDIHAGGRDGHLDWDVVEYSPGVRWQARATGAYGLHLLVTYECHAVHGGTRFVRTLEYGFSDLPMRVLNGLILHRRVERESAESVQRLREMAVRAIA
ncbi:SRPBCC family protein [Burkholderia metallica]|uniref:SRPBCC family protein n=1 Tax=Burkholderia metallica TaxID=488729 RepID=UPI00157B94C1|nr:SRPBCC family protein [Burkholderia metallica]NTZ85300.1 SRPBCC family protein [Burkholderia metallica]